MNLARFPYFAAATLALASTLAVGCDPDSKEIGATAGETDDPMTSTGTEGGSTDGTTDGGESATSGTTEDPPATTDATVTATGGESETDTATTGVLDSCGDAVTEEQCDQANANGGFTFCGWYEVSTYALDNEGVCGDLMIDEGRCVPDGWEDSGCFDYPPTCPDGTTRVFYNEVGLEVGAVELLIFEFEDICETPLGQPCVYIDDGVTQTWDPPECACGCPA